MAIDWHDEELQAIADKYDPRWCYMVAGGDAGCQMNDNYNCNFRAPCALKPGDYVLVDMGIFGQADAIGVLRNGECIWGDCGENPEPTISYYIHICME